MEREEAIKKVRQMSLPKETMEILEALAPELKESEDERMLREIKRYIKEQGNKPTGLPNGTAAVADMLAWLEKQKEPVPIPDKFSGLKSLMLQYLQSAANRKDDAEIEDDTDLWGRKILDYVWKQDEKQKEQKELPLMNGDSDAYFDEWNLQQQNPTKRQCFEEGIRYAKELHKEQKPVEKISVSEELYEHIRNACACIDDAMSSDTLCDMTDYLEMADSSAKKAFDMVERSVVKQPADCIEDSLSSNLDEAAEEYSLPFRGGRDIWMSDITNAFKAGAAWIAEQGEILDGEVVAISADDWESVRLCKKLHSVGDKVTVQIRKKQ